MGVKHMVTIAAKVDWVDLKIAFRRLLEHSELPESMTIGDLNELGQMLVRARQRLREQEIDA